MDTTTQLTGALPAVLIIAGILTAIATWVLLSLYKRATVKGMAKFAGIPAGTASADSEAIAVPELQFQTLSLKSTKEVRKSISFRISRASYRKLKSAYFWAGLLYAFFFALVYLIISGGGFILGRFLWLFICFAWPVALAMYLIRIANGPMNRSPLLFYFIALIFILIITLARNPDVGFLGLGFYWIWVNGPSTILLFAFLRKKVRAVGPMVLAFMILAVAGSLMALEIVAGSDGLLHLISDIGSSLGLGSVILFLMILAAGFLGLGIVGWFVLKWIGRKYQSKRLSDQSLTIDSLFLIFGITQSITLAFEGVFWIFTGLMAFVSYKVVSNLLLRRSNSTNGKTPQLLYLRVFALGPRSEQFFDKLSKRWRFAGSVSMISGPDLMTSAVEPHEFLDFLGGRFSRQFVKDEVDLKGRIDSLDLMPDRDGRYRVNSFFCRTDNWKITMQSLTALSNVILMDLRSFSSNNQGCLYEIGQLFNLVSLEKIIFLVDNSTDQTFLKRSMQDLWKKISSNSPNLLHESSVVNWYVISDAQPTKKLHTELLRRAEDV